MNLPVELKSINQFLTRSKEVKGKLPLVSYYCLLHGINKSMGLNLMQDDSKLYLSNLMDRAEKEKELLLKKGYLVNDDEAKLQLQKVIDQAFQKAENGFHQKAYDAKTSMAYLAAGNFLEILIITCGEKDPELEEKMTYCKYKAVQVNKLMKEGIKNKGEEAYIPPNEHTPIEPPNEWSNLSQQYPPISPITKSEENGLDSNEQQTKLSFSNDNKAFKEINNEQQTPNFNQQSIINNNNSYNSYNRDTIANEINYDDINRKQEAETEGKKLIKNALSSLTYNEPDHAIEFLLKAIEELKKMK
ncbi:hypothetical protein K502DRAFT_339719 [Neoconidiobolus thromboides FSU 785]|nr:hypothetical protein K502DRAFT_339719 [Neoconidiobolus thromboides FSU 785]